MTWVAATMGARRYLLFVYEDAQAGPSGKGVEVTGPTATPEDAHLAATQPATTVRLAGVETSPLPADWITYLGLPAEPGWMKYFRKPTAASKPWRTDPALQGSFHPQEPDDIEATFVLLKEKALEKMWVKIEAVEPGVGYRAILLNTAKSAPALAAGTKVLVRASKSHPPMLWVPAVAAANLASWSTVCEACGFDLLFIPVEDLAKMTFPQMPPGAIMERFTTRCLMCKGTMHVVNQRAAQ
jgi:hypothetical protein